jgi:hypothetical protein
MEQLIIGRGEIHRTPLHSIADKPSPDLIALHNAQSADIGIGYRWFSDVAALRQRNQILIVLFRI